MIKIHNCSIAINDLSISNYSSTHKAYTQGILSPNYPNIIYTSKRNIFEQNKGKQTYKIIVIVTLGLLILGISLYLLYKFKKIPKRIFIKYNNTKGDDETQETQESQNSQELQEIPKLYPKIT